ncbi:LuxR family transcriptional regulator [Pseudomonas syringae]|nr:LuxR family transcriptional regulator [Pseudomonas syringae]MCF5068678.1 LuxR family transcriptional regulator [Pseudomonas syringae]
MEIWKESQLKQLTLASRIETAFPILLKLTENIGFNFCAITIVANKHDRYSKLLQINNFSKEWNQKYEDEHYNETDPVLTHCNHSMLPIVWSEKMFCHAPDLWQTLQQQEVRHGWSQAFHDESGRCAILSLARKHHSISPLELYEHFGYLFYVTSHLIDLFTRNLPQGSQNPHPPRLSSRELEVLKLSAGGKTAYEIARILSLSERTVNYHVQNVIMKLNVCNKISAVIAATRAGII